MKITFLGVSGALSAKYNSNMLIESNGETMLFDCGEDVMHSLKAAGRTPEELDAVYISHLHFDHCGGLSWLAYYTYFICKRKLKLYIHESLVSDLWAMLRPANEKLNGQDRMMTLTDYFEVKSIRDNHGFTFAGMMHYLARQPHVETLQGSIYSSNMYSYGLKSYNAVTNNWESFISSDTKRLTNLQIEDPEDEWRCDYSYIFCDCDVMNLGGVHPNYDVLKELDEDIKSKMWLYHYTNLDDYNGQFGEMPDAVADGFAGFVKEGQIFEI